MSSENFYYLRTVPTDVWYENNGQLHVIEADDCSEILIDEFAELETLDMKKCDITDGLAEKNKVIEEQKKVIEDQKKVIEDQKKMIVEERKKTEDWISYCVQQQKKLDMQNNKTRELNKERAELKVKIENATWLERVPKIVVTDEERSMMLIYLKEYSCD